MVCEVNQAYDRFTIKTNLLGRFICFDYGHWLAVAAALPDYEFFASTKSTTHTHHNILYDSFLGAVENLDVQLYFVTKWVHSFVEGVQNCCWFLQNMVDKSRCCGNSNLNTERKI